MALKDIQYLDVLQESCRCQFTKESDDDGSNGEAAEQSQSQMILCQKNTDAWQCQLASTSIELGLPLWMAALTRKPWNKAGMLREGLLCSTLAADGCAERPGGHFARRNSC